MQQFSLSRSMASAAVSISFSYTSVKSSSSFSAPALFTVVYLFNRGEFIRSRIISAPKKYHRATANRSLLAHTSPSYEHWRETNPLNPNEFSSLYVVSSVAVLYSIPLSSAEQQFPMEQPHPQPPPVLSPRVVFGVLMASAL